MPEPASSPYFDTNALNFLFRDFWDNAAFLYAIALRLKNNERLIHRVLAVENENPSKLVSIP